jgi:hypothetical protein
VPTFAAWDLIASGAWHCLGPATRLPVGCTYKQVEEGNFGRLFVMVAGSGYALLCLLIYILVPAAQGRSLRRWLIASLLPGAELVLIAVAVFG